MPGAFVELQFETADADVVPAPNPTYAARG